MPSLTQLEYLLALHRTGHFGKAAAECHVSQPTLSAQVAKAEAELGLTVFDRRTKPVVVTEPGRRIVEHAREVLRAHGRLLAAAEGSTELSGEFTLGIIPTLAPFVLPWFLGPFSKAHPKVELTVVERTTETIVSEIGGMRMDGGLVATPLGEAGIERRVLFYDPFYVYAQAGSSLLEQDELTLADIDRDDLWLLEDGHCFRHQVVHLCGVHDRNLLGNVRFEAGSFDTLRAIIDRAGGFTIIPESYARTLPSDVRLARVRAFADAAPTREVSLVAHRAQWKTDILEALAASLRKEAPRSLPREPGEGLVLPVQ